MHNTSRTIHQAAFDPDILRQHDFRALAEYDNLVQVLSLLVRSIPRPTRPSVPCVDGNHWDLQISQLLIVELIHNPVRSKNPEGIGKSLDFIRTYSHLRSTYQRHPTQHSK